MKINWYAKLYLDHDLDKLINDESFKNCCNCRISLDLENSNQCIVFYAYNEVCINTICNICVKYSDLSRMYSDSPHKICKSINDAKIFIQDIKKIGLLK